MKQAQKEQMVTLEAWGGLIKCPVKSKRYMQKADARYVGTDFDSYDIAYDIYEMRDYSGDVFAVEA